MTQLDLIRRLEEQFKVKLQQIAFDELDDFERYSPSKKRTYITDDDANVIALGLDTVLGLETSVLECLTSLRKLSLRDNPLTSDALQALSALPRVNFLDVSGTKVTDLCFLRSWPSLVSVCLRNCKALSLPTLNTLVGLRHLDLSNNGLEDLPSEIGDLCKLERLGLRNNALGKFSHALLSLTKLVDLDLSTNKLEDLPSEIGDLRNLERLDLSDNELKDLPSEIGDLRNLERLDLRNNALGKFPHALLSLTQLKRLDLRNVQLRELPSGISRLTNLEKLDIAQNQLFTLPSAISNLRTLKLLDCAENQLVSIPSSVFSLDLALYSDDNFYDWDRMGHCLYGNSLESPPREIVDRGTEAVREYFHSLEGKRRSNNEVKILLVGDGGAGKTSLVKQLLGEPFQPNEATTHGINIQDWRSRFQNKRITAHFWDFGGQEIMHATHQFFLSKRSLYILVLDGRKDEKVEYWLKHIESFGGDSPVLVVLNKMDENPSFEVNRKFLKNKFRGIRGFYRLSCADGTGIRTFRTAVRKEMATVDILETMWPESWFKVKATLVSQSAHYLSYEKINAICSDEGINERSSQTVLLNFLHDLGIVLHFPDHDLENIHVLEPKWVTQAVYRILNSRPLAESHGILKLRNLHNVLNKRSKHEFVYAPHTYGYIIALMKKFELCYEIHDDEILIPDLLEVEEPEFEFNQKDSLKFVIEYEFLPRSVIPRFIVKMHGDIQDSLRWRSGVVLKNGEFNAIALIRSDDDAKKIYIYVNGTQRKDYFAVLLFVFRSINKDFKKLKYLESVPMPDNPSVMVSYRHLVRLALKGVDKYHPDGSEGEYDVNELLGSIALPKSTGDEILQLLTEKFGKFPDKESLIEELNDIIEVKPNLFGVGIDFNELLKKVMKNK